MVKRLSLGEPALYDDAGTEHCVFADSRFNLDHFATVGALANVLAGLPAGWTPPLNPDGTVDRDAVEADVITRVASTIVCPADITYPPGDPNPWQTTLDANSSPTSIRGGGAVPTGWIPLKAAL